jgi:hypothetical protein
MTIACFPRSPRRFAAGRPAACLLAALLLAVAWPALAAAEPPQEPEEPATGAAPDEATAEQTATLQEAAAPQPDVPPPAAAPLGVDLDHAQATMGRILEVGRAMHAWARDTRLERGRRQPTSRMPKQVRWDRCPGVQHAELEELLVPAYLRELPAEDAWDRPLQFCLDRRLAGSEQQYGVRSAGSDGRYGTDRYEVGGFPDTSLDADLVWMDGYFIRWPEPQ